MTIFSWPPPIPPSSSGGTSAGLETTGAPVDVSGAAPPVAGQVLTASSPTTAEWRVPGLKYDPAIRFNVDAGGTATIEPGTWGFVYTYPVTATAITIFVVSSLSAPPVDSRFGLYVSPSVAVPVTVSLIGASLIMDLNGTLGTTAELRPGAMYEWVFYHESGEAIWGLVSQTGVLPSIADTVANALPVDFVLTTPQTLDGNSGVYDGVTVANDYTVLITGQSPASENGYWLTHDGPWERAPGYPEPPDILAGQGAYVRNGNTQAGSLWMDFGNDVWRAISVGDATSVGTGLVKTGSRLSLGAHASTHARGGTDLVAASQLSESSGPTTLSIGAVATGQYLQRSGTTIVGVTAPAPAAHASTHNRGGSDVVIASKLSESAGPTTLDINAIADGQFLKRSGSTIIGAAAGAGATTDVYVLGSNEDLTPGAFSNRLVVPVTSGQAVLIEYDVCLFPNTTGSGTWTIGIYAAAAFTATYLYAEAIGFNIGGSGVLKGGTSIQKPVPNTSGGFLSVISFPWSSQVETPVRMTVLLLPTASTNILFGLSESLSSFVHLRAGSWARATRGLTSV